MMGSGIPQGMMGVPAGMMGGQGMQQGMMGTQTGMMGSQGMMGSGAGIAGLNQGMAGMSLQSPTGSMNMMGPRPMMSQQMGQFHKGPQKHCFPFSPFFFLSFSLHVLLSIKRILLWSA